MALFRSHRRWLQVGAPVAAAALIFTSCSGSEDVEEAEAARDEAIESADALEAEVEQLNEQVATLEADVASVTEERDAALASAEEAEALAETESERADTAEASLETAMEEFAAAFPITVESTLAGLELSLEGSYTIGWAEAYCEGFTSCGTLPSVTTAAFVRTPENFLRLNVDGILDAGLFSIDGALYGITDSTTALPPCDDGTPRVARITVTAYSDDVTIAQDGTRTIDRLGSSITVDSPDLPGCPGGLVFYGTSLTPTG